jgi:DNA-binding NtrC family response regulator
VTETAVQSKNLSSARTAVLVSADAAFRQRLRSALSDLRWQVREAGRGAETLACLDASPAEAVVLDSWLPDLEIHEFVDEFRKVHPDTDLIMADATLASGSAPRGPRRNEVLLALRRAQATDDAIWNVAPGSHARPSFDGDEVQREQSGSSTEVVTSPARPAAAERDRAVANPLTAETRLSEFVGSHPALLEVSRRIRLVAPRTTSVLIEGPTGSGKELVAKALHRLSPRATRKLIALNCAAIPDGLLEAELFGHARGAFTGAVENRTGRIEAANGGTLFLDEIGEMPLPLQAKLLRFLETGELQRVGNNDSIAVDVRFLQSW